mmetsp:Transcript_9033/g.13351  ORF Transcript_9033/g.13351 Transcript_9033/m.13351 type:complete len:91 (-) Transcript_9033:71-343(-)
MLAPRLGVMHLSNCHFDLNHFQKQRTTSTKYPVAVQFFEKNTARINDTYDLWHLRIARESSPIYLVFVSNAKKQSSFSKQTLLIRQVNTK